MVVGARGILREPLVSVSGTSVAHHYNPLLRLRRLVGACFHDS